MKRAHQNWKLPNRRWAHWRIYSHHSQPLPNYDYHNATNLYSVLRAEPEVPRSNPRPRHPFIIKSPTDFSLPITQKTVILGFGFRKSTPIRSEFDSDWEWCEYIPQWAQRRFLRVSNSRMRPFPLQRTGWSKYQTIYVPQIRAFFRRKLGKHRSQIFDLYWATLCIFREKSRSDFALTLWWGSKASWNAMVMRASSFLLRMFVFEAWKESISGIQFSYRSMCWTLFLFMNVSISFFFPELIRNSGYRAWPSFGISFLCI